MDSCSCCIMEANVIRWMVGLTRFVTIASIVANKVVSSDAKKFGSVLMRLV